MDKTYIIYTAGQMAVTVKSYAQVLEKIIWELQSIKAFMQNFSEEKTMHIFRSY